MDRLDELESRSIYVIREAYARFRKLALLWSIGKDSTTLVLLARKAFFGRLPFPVLHIDTGHKFPEIYAFRDRYVREFGLELVIARNEDALASGMGPGKKDKLLCCTQLKTEALRGAILQHGFEALLLGIRRDEHGIRAKERYFSPRDDQFKWDYKNQPPELWDQFQSSSEDRTHIRVHPLLHWTELDVWQYVRREKLPVCPLYFAKNGKRYRSIGCAPCCAPIDSDADTVDKIVEELRTTTSAERAGRAQDKESAYTMQKLRALGYM
jgi:sulfate adenylyltransferase subunit 2